jgi:hypothetical protein
VEILLILAVGYGAYRIGKAVGSVSAKLSLARRVMRLF